MPDTRTLPIAAEHREFTIKVDGAAMPREHQLLAVSVSLVVNRIASARLVYLDGSASSSDFPLGNADLLAPGKSIEIMAGAGTQQTSLFKGYVVRHNVRVRDNSAPQLIVDCRHGAMKMAVVRSNASYFDQSDSDVIEALISKAGLTADVASTSLKHKQMVQFHTSNWDFLLSRAQANGLLVWADGDKLVAKLPDVSAEPTCTLQFGATLLEFPLTTARFWRYSMPAAGGGYFRLYPYALSRALFQRATGNNKTPAIFYLHPWEIDPDQPRVPGAGLLSNFRHYNNLDRCMPRLRAMINDFPFGTVSESLASVDLTAQPPIRLTAA